MFSLAILNYILNYILSYNSLGRRTCHTFTACPRSFQSQEACGACLDWRHTAVISCNIPHIRLSLHEPDGVFTVRPHPSSGGETTLGKQRCHLLASERITVCWTNCLHDDLWPGNDYEQEHTKASDTWCTIVRTKPFSPPLTLRTVGEKDNCMLMK